MKLLGFKEMVKGWLVFSLALGFLPLAFTEKIIHPFLLTPAAEVEKYNYVAHIVVCIVPIILLGVAYAIVSYYSKINIDERLNKLVKNNNKSISRLLLALIIYYVKELFDYLTYENAMPECFNHAWFLILWELLPVFLLLFWALVPFNPLKKNAST